jgi:hypothetical protein
VIHYAVSTPTATTAVFVSEPAKPGPPFKLSYELRGGVMYGKFEMLLPGQAEWKPYLVWSGKRQ